MGNGIQKGFHPNGKPARIIHCHHNQKHGDQEFYDVEGKHRKTTHYSFGNLLEEKILTP